MSKSSEREELSVPVRIAMVIGLLAALWCFLFGLGLMGDSFKVLGGKSAGNLFDGIKNPLAGLMVGILATVLVQSSSTSTSIVVGLVGSGIMGVATAIPIIMGANIGTSVTNTLVSLGHMNNKDEYQRAFAGATVHDMFNFLTVLILLPTEVIVGGLTGTAGQGILYHISKGMTSALEGAGGDTFKSPVKVIVSPATKALLSVDKNKINALSMAVPKLDTCIDKVVAKVNYNICGNATAYAETLKLWDENIMQGSLVKGGAFEGTSDSISGTVCLIISLLVLCAALFAIVTLLKKLVLGSAGADAEKGIFAKFCNMNGYLAIVTGMLLTICVQSSSIITSAFTPLVGIGTLPLENMLAFSVGANIGTTCTGLLAALVAGTVPALQIALCHLLFNIIGTLIWYPAPFMRALPLSAARAQGYMTVCFSWWPMAYVAAAFFLLPLIMLGVSALIDVGGVATAFGWVLLIIFVGCAVGFGVWFKYRGGKERILEALEPRYEAGAQKIKEAAGAAQGKDLEMGAKA